MNTEIKKQLSVLELSDLAAVVEAQEKEISFVDLNYNGRLEHLLSALITERQNRLIARLTKNADLKHPNASLETLDCNARDIRMPDMLGHFQTHKDNLRERVRYRKKLGNYKVLTIDEWLNYKINEKESKFIYELVEQRCGNNPTIFVGQYEVCDWHERLGGGTQADSIMDRIIHNSYSIPATDNNLRKLYDSQKARKPMESLNS